MLKSDFHIHTGDDPVDHLGHTSEELLDFAQSKNFKVLAITNHTAMTFYDDLKRYAEGKGILLIPGIECSIEKKHVVVLNPPGGCIEGVETFDDLKRYKEKNPGIFVMAPHPFYPKHHCLGDLLIEHIDLFDGIEYSHCYLPFFNPYNQQAEDVAHKYGRPLVGTSDLHHFCQMDYTYSLVEAELTVDSVIKALKSGQLQIISRPMSLVSFFRMVFAMGRNDIFKVIRSLYRMLFKKTKRV